ncbi:MAG: hypothetical protein EOP62_11540 [Sphingomonadales bacterium]|nr:MAG: hypothetical protein EOP62_11540 [Sphingomonadales bacterium]
MFSNAITPAPSVRADEPTNILNAVAVGAADIEAALHALASLPAGVRDDPFAQAAALQDLARALSPDCDALLAAALHARVSALAKWTAVNDPGRQSDAWAVLEAAARFPLCDRSAGIGFEPGGFQELILFISELPW